MEEGKKKYLIYNHIICDGLVRLHRFTHSYIINTIVPFCLSASAFYALPIIIAAIAAIATILIVDDWNEPILLLVMENKHNYGRKQYMEGWRRKNIAIIQTKLQTND